MHLFVSAGSLDRYADPVAEGTTSTYTGLTGLSCYKRITLDGRQTFQNLPWKLVFRQGEPRGFRQENLTEIGKSVSPLKMKRYIEGYHMGAQQKPRKGFT